MKRYWIFIADEYYPQGGMEDWKGEYDTIEECTIEWEMTNLKQYKRYHILDTVNRVIIKSEDNYDEVLTNIELEKFINRYD